MLSKVTKSQILADRFAYTSDEMLLVPAIDICEELIEADNLRHNYNKLVRQYGLLLDLYRAKDCPSYKVLNLKA